MGDGLSEAIVGFVSTITMAVFYRVYKYFKKESLCMLKYVVEDGMYKIECDKQEHIIEFNLNKLDDKIKKLSQQYDILNKSKMSYEHIKLNKLLQFAEAQDRGPQITIKKDDNIIDIIELKTQE